jgi:ABC-type Fe3+-hydroxamate transport system substrate-binding protein
MQQLGRQLALILTAASLLASCAKDAPDNDSRPGDTLQPIVLRDATGRMVTLARPASRVVSLAPNLTEILFAVGAGDAVVGRTEHCNYPADANRIAVVSDLITPNYERIVALKPDLVLMTFVGNSSAAYDKLVELGLEPVVLAAADLDGTLGAIDTVGRLVGRDEAAASVIASIRATIDSVRALVRGRPRVSTFIVLDRAPLMTVSGGFVNEALEVAGGANIAAGDPVAYPRYSREEVLRRNPDVIIVPGDSSVATDNLVESFPEWRNLDAVRSGRVRSISADLLFRPGPRVGDAILMLFDLLHRPVTVSNEHPSR